MTWLDIAILVLVICFGVGALFGAPFLPVRKQDITELLELSELRQGDTLIDLGSGSGSLLLAAAQRGVRGVGYEINPILYFWSLLKCWPVRRLVTIHLGDFWSAELPPADVIYVFLIARYMEKLDQKLVGLQRPIKLMSYVFAVPGRKPIKQSYNTYIYQYGKVESQPGK
jgi:hypothetical protein